jgi:hypothetical protein
LELSRGGNSHQSETNLIERPLKQSSPAPARVVWRVVDEGASEIKNFPN